MAAASSSSSSSSLPDWVMVDRYAFKDSSPSSSPTEASCTNSRGDEVSISFVLREPPQPSRLHLSWPAGKGDFDRFFIVSAHRDAVLLQMIYPIPTAVQGRRFIDVYDYFIYTAGDGSCRPSLERLGAHDACHPSLERLPSIDGSVADLLALLKVGAYNLTNQRLRRMEGLDLGILRSGKKSAVLELQVDRLAKFQVEVHVFYPNRATSQWMVRHPKIDFGNSEMNLENLVLNWSCDVVMAVGGFICWVDYCLGGILMCDVFRSCSLLYYIPFPAKLPDLDRTLHGGSLAELYQSVSVNEEQGLIVFCMIEQLDGKMPDVRFRPEFGFRVRSWSLKVTERNMTWAMGSVLLSDQLWSLQNLELPRVPLEFPVVSMADPNITCFVLREEREVGMEETSGYDYDETLLIAVDMTTQTVLSSSIYIGKAETHAPKDVEFIKYKYRYFQQFLPSELPKYVKLRGASED